MLPTRPAGRTLTARAEMVEQRIRGERIRVPGAPNNGAYEHADASDDGARCDRSGGFARAAGHWRGSPRTPRHWRPGVARAGSDTVAATVANKISYSLIIQPFMISGITSDRSAGFDQPHPPQRGY